MRILKQLMLILAVWLVGEIISKFLPFPMPGNVIAMILMLVLLLLRIVRVEKIAQVSTFFLDNISFFFIPASVAIMVSYKAIGSSLGRAFIAICVTNILVFLVTGYITEWLIRLNNRRKERKNGKS